MSKKALIIGINEYGGSSNLNGCVNDAKAIEERLSTNSDGSPNFTTRLLTADQSPLNAETILTNIRWLFAGNASTVLLYFSGHGLFDESLNAGYLVTSDHTAANPGIPFPNIVNIAAKASGNIHSSVIILDCCHSGALGELSGIGYHSNISALPEGMSILTASHRVQTASEQEGQGKFTKLLLDGLDGASADVLGRITPASLYSTVDQVLGEFEQRPIYKANVERFIQLRQTTSRVPLEFLRQLHVLFETEDDIFALGPECEPIPDRSPDRNGYLSDVAYDKVKNKTYKELQKCNRVGLVVPVVGNDMYWAAINKDGCKLTEIGKHYRKLAKLKRF